MIKQAARFQLSGNPARRAPTAASHGRWFYAGDGDSTLHMIDLDAPTAPATRQVIKTGGTKRLDKLALTRDGNLLIAVNRSDDPPFLTLFAANGDRATSSVTMITKITVDPAIIPVGFGLGLKSAAWERRTQRFTSRFRRLPIIRSAAITVSLRVTPPAAGGPVAPESKARAESDPPAVMTMTGLPWRRARAARRRSARCATNWR